MVAMIDGTLRVVRFDDGSGYSAVFAPDHSDGGALPQLRLSTREALKAFLLDIGLSEASTDQVLAELSAKNSVSCHTGVSFELLGHYGLAPLGVAESIRRYLSV